MYIDYVLLLTLVSINAIGALGYYFTFSSGQFSMGHGALFMVGGYTTGSITTSLGLPGLSSVPLAFLIAAALGWFVAFALRRIRGLYFAVATLAFGNVAVEAIKHVEPLGGAYGLGGIEPFTTLPVALALLALTIFAVWRFDRSPMYVVHAGARIDQDAAAVLGIDVGRTRSFAFAIGGGITAVAGALYAGTTTVVSPQTGGFEMSLSFLLMVIIGGAQSWRGPILGAVIWTALPELLRATAEWRMVAFGVAAILIMIWRPEGIIPRRIFRGRSLTQVGPQREPVADNA
jgi:branched-chain amino acid transport system permease protein